MALRIEESVDGRLVCTRLELGSSGDKEKHEIGAASLRRIPLGQILDRIARELAKMQEFAVLLRQDADWSADARRRAVEACERDDFEGLLAASKELAPLHLHDQLRPPKRDEQAERPGLRGRSIEFYERLATVYRQALVEDPRHPYRYVVAHAREDNGNPVWTPPRNENRDEFFLRAEASARKLVYRARQRGLMGRGIQGKAGEYPALRSDNSEGGPSRKSGQS